jgi:hypothetical protein
MATHRVFISFEMEDRWARDFLKQQSSRRAGGPSFVDFSVKDPYDRAWKTECRKQIARTRGTIVLIGSTTYASVAVAWEIEETKRQSHRLLGMQINANKSHPIPSGIKSSQVIPWNLDKVTAHVSSWD